MPHDDPIGQVEFVNGLAEPLWDDIEDAEDEPPIDPTEEETVLPSESETQLMPAEDVSGETQLMDEADVSDETQLMDGGFEDELPDDQEPEEAPADEDAGEEELPEKEPADEDEELADDERDAGEEPEEGEPEEEADEDVVIERPAPYREPFQTIDVGMEQNWYENRSYYERTRPTDHRRAYEGDAREPGSLNVWMVIGIAAIAILSGLLIAHIIFDNAGNSTNEEEVVITSKNVSKVEATRIIVDLDGWWKTGRTFDGRYWHLQEGLMELYAADGKLASQVLVDPAAVERLDQGPGGIEGAGYYLRDVGYYLVDDDPDTLHAIDQDGSANEDANLLRSDPPAFVSDGKKKSDDEERDASDEDLSEYILPEASTRVYDNAELEALSDHDLFVARNEIYARHGYVFETGELSEYFSSKSWYKPSDVFNEGEISEIERQNVSAILAIELARGSRYV